MAPTPLPTVAPAAATLFPAAVPPVPQGWTQAQTTDWITHHECKSLSKQIVEFCTFWTSYPLIDRLTMYPRVPTDTRTIPVIHLLDAVHEHVGALPNRQTNHVRELSRLYWNEHVAGTVLSGLKNNRWANTGSLFSQSVPTRLPW